MADSIDRLFQAVRAAQAGGNGRSRTAKLLNSGRIKIAKKVVEEAAEVSFEAVLENREAVIRESADLMYNLVVMWADAGITPKDVWSEMTRREQAMGIAEKLPKSPSKSGAKALSKATPAPRRKSRPVRAG
ncbi:phosphoribosyl-ATP diphosphatase [Blastochloris tepida]|uniref:phosphoribosyl-ATP diphosphatase n=1 Tax=Blastochloris tepida TaxID=2233851 RepID=A0A348G4I8_9HYPH|nr:phosphoribosyl-ATP diphosphatase [Blastochloris tepida]BBF94471.1 phosphoribosyl-ATP pyrophosphatase 2 [Blastochloris tepida]